MEELEIIETPFGSFTENIQNGKSAEEVYQKWLEKYCKLVDGEWIRKTEEELETDKTNNLPSDKERIEQLEKDKAELAQNLYAVIEVLEIMVTGGTEIAD